MLVAKTTRSWLLVFMIVFMNTETLYASDNIRPPVRAKVLNHPVTVKAGDTVNAIYTIEILYPYHIQANPASYDYLIPAQLHIDDANGINTGTPVYPAGKQYQLTGSNMKLSVYDGTITIEQPIQVGTGVSPGKYHLNGKFRFQACDHKRCLPPETLVIDQTVEVIGRH